MKRIAALFLLMTLLLAACETTGSSQGASKNCRSSGTSGSCTITIQSIQGTVSQKIENSAFRSSHDAAQVTVKMTGASGAVRLYVNGPDNQQNGVEVQPGGTAELTGPADITGTDPRGFNVYFEVLEEGASVENIQAEVTYEVP